MMESGNFNGSYKHHHKTTSVSRQYAMGKKPTCPNKGASFIKVLGRDFYTQLQLPEDFTKKMDGYIPHRFIIESVTTKNCWRVEVQKDGDGRMYFRDGWADFVKAHSLEVGNFLLFEYEEQSIFQTRIYGRNGCEKTILVDNTKEEPPKTNNTIDDEDGDEIEALEFEPVLVKRHRQKTKRLTPRRCIYKTRHPVPRSYRRTMRVSVSQNNLCFSVVMHKFKKHQFIRLTVPKSVSLMMKLPSKDQVRLQDAEGNSWTVKLAHRTDGRALFALGWKEFLKDNNVSPGDKLSFEFMSDELIQVCVTKVSKVQHQTDEANEPLNPECKHDQPSASAPSDMAVKTSKTSKRIIVCESGSSFSLMWRMSQARSYLHMPKAVVEDQKLMKKQNLVLRDPEGKCWPVELKKLSGNRVVLAKGWVEFWKGYGLTFGDDLKFEFVSENLIHVSISRAKPLLEADVEDGIICLETTDDNEEAAAIETAAVITREEFDAAIEPQGVVPMDEIKAAIEPETVVGQEESAVVIGPEPVISQEEFDSFIEPEAVITRGELDLTATQHGENDVMN